MSCPICECDELLDIANLLLEKPKAPTLSSMESADKERSESSAWKSTPTICSSIKRDSGKRPASQAHVNGSGQANKETLKPAQTMFQTITCIGG